MWWRIAAATLVFMSLAIVAPAKDRLWIRVKREWIVGALADRNTCEPYANRQMLCHDVVIEFAAFEVVPNKR